MTTGIIDNARNNSYKKSIDLYGRTVEQAAASYKIKHSKTVTLGLYTSSNDGKILTKDTTELLIDYSGNKVRCDVIIANGEKAYMNNCYVNDSYVNYEYRNIDSLITLVDGVVGEIGSKYLVNVNDVDLFYFYLLSKNSDSTVNLIMDRNICNDGTIKYTLANNYCIYAWHAGEDNNNYGPDTAMINLYNATKNWKNVDDMIMNYSDVGNGYLSIMTSTSDKVTTIMGKNYSTSDNQVFGNTEYPLKARLATFNEILDAGCELSASDESTNGSCPIWLMENMKYYNLNNDKYSINNNDESYQNILGYCLLSSSASSVGARMVGAHGIVGSNYVTANIFGIRPVTTIKEGDL